MQIDTVVCAELEMALLQSGESSLVIYHSHAGEARSVGTGEISMLGERTIVRIAPCPHQAHSRIPPAMLDGSCMASKDTAGLLPEFKF